MVLILLVAMYSNTDKTQAEATIFTDRLLGNYSYMHLQKEDGKMDGFSTKAELLI